MARPGGRPPALGLPLGDSELLRAVQLGRLFPDSKEFVDMPLAAPAEEISRAFEACGGGEKPPPGREALHRFIADHFHPAGSDLERAELADWRAEPQGFLPSVSGEPRELALGLHALWRDLGRRTCSSLAANPERHSLLYLPHPTVVPGGRFRETYYWDSLWIVQGLLVSCMPHTAVGIVENLLHLLRAHGRVPNGGRTYYLGRSQPPLLSQMLRVLWDAPGVERVKGPGGLAERSLEPLLEEHRFMTEGNRTVMLRDSAGAVHCLGRYFVQAGAPRPESFWEDFDLAAPLQSQSARESLYSELATAAESGWDFSSRWMEGGMSLQDTMVRRVIPVDLNVFLLQMEENIAFFAENLGRLEISVAFLERAKKRRRAMNAVMWDDCATQWKDIIMEDLLPACSELGGVASWRLSEQIVASNFLPLWVGLDEVRGPDVVKALENSGLVLVGGISTSLVDSGQQWDYPNAWPPLQLMLIEGVSRHDAAFADSLAQRWLRACFEGFKASGTMQEKYDATVLGRAGGGGEYDVQVGFGWTNGVALVLLQKFGFLSPSDSV